MSKADLHQRLNRASEIRLSVKGRNSGRDISRPVWYVMYFCANLAKIQTETLTAETLVLGSRWTATSKKK